MNEALGQSGRLDVQNLFARRGHLIVGRNEGMSIDGAQELERMFVQRRFAVNHLCMGFALGIDERGIGLTLGAQAFDVNLCRLHLRLEREAVTLDQHAAILKNHRIAAVDHILRRLAETARAVDVAAHGARTLLCHQRTQVAVLTDELVAGGAVEDNLGTSHRQVVAWRNRCPDILADFHAELHAVGCLKQLRFGRQTDGRAGQIDVSRIQVLRRSKPALLVELVVVGQISLGDDAQNAAALDDCGAVEQESASLNRQSDNANDVEFAGKLQQHEQPFFRFRQQQLLLEQVLTRVTRNAQFRETHNLNMLAVSKRNELFNLLDVVFHVSHANSGNGSSHFDESVLHIFLTFEV